MNPEKTQQFFSRIYEAQSPLTEHLVVKAIYRATWTELKDTDKIMLSGDGVRVKRCRSPRSEMSTDSSQEDRQAAAWLYGRVSAGSQATWEAKINKFNQEGTEQMKIIEGVKWGAALFAVASLCGCASIVDGRTPKISINSSPAGAR